MISRISVLPRWWTLWTLLPILLAVAACSSANHPATSGTIPASSPSTLVAGAVVDAFVINATVQAFPVSATGAVSGTCIPATPATSPSTCATATTDGGGNYTINLGDYSGAVLLEATGGSYTDTVTGQTVQLPSGLTLSVLLPAVAPGTTSITAQITPLTTIAAQMALQAASQGAPLATASSTATAAVASYLGGLQNLSTTPLLNLLDANCANGASQASEDASLILAGLSELASQYNVSTVALVQAVIEDASDGTLDGALNGVPLSVPQLTGGGSVALATIYGSGLAQSLEASIATFEQSATDACNAQQSSTLEAGLTNPPSSQLGSPEYSYTLQGSLSGFSGSTPVQVTYAVSFACSADSAAPPSVTFPLGSNGSFAEAISGTPSSYAAIDYTNSCGNNQWSLVVVSPPGLNCQATPASGTFSSSEAGNANTAQTSPAISCTTATYTVGGPISGLSTAGLVLVDQGGFNSTPIDVAANQTSFAFTGYVSGDSYEIAVQTQPAGQTCSVTNGTGTVGNANVTTVAVSCQTLSASAETVLWSFNTSGAGGWNPEGWLVQDTSGNLYGTALEGGAQGGGTVFELSPQAGGSYQEATLWGLGACGDGSGPTGGLAIDSSGNIFGATGAGGTVGGNASCSGEGSGTVFELSPQQGGGYQESVLWSFGASDDGVSPFGGVIVDSNGNVYGTTTEGGTYANQCESPAGTVFEVSPGAGNGSAESLLWTFCYVSNSYPNGENPESQLMLDASGNLFGTTVSGGASNSGGTFELSPQSGGGYAFAVLSNAAAQTSSTCIAPAAAEGALVEDSAGNIFGTEVHGGTSNCGSVFELSPQAGGGYIKTVLWSFGGSGDGSYPYGGLVFDSHGNLYGTTRQGGAKGAGTVFELALQSGGGYQESVLWSFGGPNDGSLPAAGLVIDSKGNLYGATGSGGAYGYGTVFRVTTGP